MNSYAYGGFVVSNHYLLFIPEVNPNTLLFFYFRGDTGRSYSFRDYSVPDHVHTTYAKQYPYTADEILAMARFQFPAPVHDTNDLKFWHVLISDHNRRYLKNKNPSPTISQATGIPVGQPATPVHEEIAVRNSASKQARSRASSQPGTITSTYPVLGVERLRKHPVKGAKPQDLDRILTSPNSEDWVTWNVAELMHLLGPTAWWGDLVKLAKRNNSGLQEALLLNDQPTVDLWRKVPSPRAYEEASRARLAQSTNQEHIERSRDHRPVEGASEIDLVLDSTNYLIFIEAKLGADISPRTTYDPERNQIVRNIDCALERGNGRLTAFWMLVGDVGPGRAYTQLMSSYQLKPQQLLKLLPHRSLAEVDAIARNLAIIRWQDFLRSLSAKIESARPLNAEIESVLSELRRRLS